MFYKKGEHLLKNLWITGYRSYELGIFKDDDLKVKVIKNYFKNRIINYIENGVEWILTGANLGTEMIIGEVVEELKQENYQIELAVIIPYQNFEGNWNDSNKQKLNIFLRKADYFSYLSDLSYTNYVQLINWQSFMLKHTDGVLMFYDLENVGKPKYDYKAVIKYIEKNPDYSLELVDFDSMQDFANSMFDNY
ncbi:SLOG family protein [Lactobacillus terrae]|uniref:SLOG family protein n=1 Tax=Lactobacillus terrae TaxID=2269374 RepID=UPI000C1B65DA|nr:SLOG family protein [Lactobacillus terrae]